MKHSQKKTGKCEEGKICDPLAADASVDEEVIRMYFNQINGGHDMCIVPEMPPTQDCDIYGASDLTVMEDDDGNNVADNGVYYALSYANLCRQEKDHQAKMHEIENMWVNQTQQAATHVATTRLRRRMRRVLEARVGQNKPLHPAIRKLAGLEADFRDSNGRRLEQMREVKRRKLQASYDSYDYYYSDYPSMEYEDPMYESDMNALANDYIYGSTYSPTYDDVHTMMHMQPWDRDVKDMLNNWIEDYEEELEHSYTEFYDNRTSLATQMGNAPQDTDHYRQVVEDLAFSTLDPHDDYYQPCTSMPYGSDIVDTTQDIDGDGIPDWEVLSHCMSHFLPEVSADTTHDMDMVANGQMPINDAMKKYLPEAANITAMRDVKDTMTMIDSKCYTDCAMRQIDHSVNGTMFGGFDADCAGAAPALADGRVMDKCDMLHSYGNTLMNHEATATAAAMSRRLTVEKRKLKIQEERRRLQGDQVKDCMQIDGRTFCPEGAKPRKLQEIEDHFEAIGVRYLVQDFVTRKNRPGKARRLTAAKMKANGRKTSRKAFHRKKRSMRRKLGKRHHGRH